MANQLTGYIQDAFTSTSANAQWTVSQLGSATLSFVSTGASVVFPATTSSSTDGDVTYAAGQVLNLTGSFVRLNVLSVAGAGATHTDCVLRVRTAANNYVTIFYEAGTIFFSKVLVGSQTNIASLTYNATNHAWWQIREKGGTTYWETSVDGVTWTTQVAQANPITVTAVDILIGGLCFGIDTSPANFTFRGLNYPLPGTTTSTSSTSVSSTSSSISSTSTSLSSTSSSLSSTSTSLSTSSTSTSISSTSTSISSTSSSLSSTSSSSTSSSTSISSTSTSISSTSTSSTSISSTSSSTSASSTSTSFSSTSSSISTTSSSVSSTSVSSTSSSSSTSTTTLPPPYLDYTYQDLLSNNLANNGNFENAPPFTSKTRGNAVFVDGTAGGSFTASQYIWTTDTGFTTGDASYDSTTSNSGTYSYHVRLLGTGEFIENGMVPARTVTNILAAQYLIAVKPNTTYNYSYYMKTNYVSGDSADGAFLSFATYDATGTAIGGTSGTKIKTTTGWTQYKNSVTPGPTEQYIMIAPRIYGHTGTGTLIMDAWFDDIILVPSVQRMDTNNDLMSPFTIPNYSNVGTDDGDYFIAKGSQHLIQEYKIIHQNNNDNITFTWKGRSTVSTLVSPILFQIYNVNSASWETLAIQNKVIADTDFITTVTKSTNPSNYYDSRNIVTFRSYQLVV